MIIKFNCLKIIFFITGESKMEVYDTVMVPCPVCGKKFGAQSKSGDCSLAEYELKDAPQDVLQDINRHAPFYCGCGTVFEVDFYMLGYSKILSVDLKLKEKT